MKAKSYYVVLTAGPGELLYGGSRTHQSSRFETRRQAEDWMDATLAVNHGFPRNLYRGRSKAPNAKGEIHASTKAPEILAAETGHSI